MNDAAPVLSSRLVYEGRIFDVTVDRVRLPHGREADLEIVRHDGSVVLVPMDDDGRVLLICQASDEQEVPPTCRPRWDLGDRFHSQHAQRNACNGRKQRVSTPGGRRMDGRRMTAK